MTVSPPATSQSATKDAASIRKRRRRATAGGAADDCFTCSKRNVKCDRRRPYCSQCLELGNECSGYKTQLTWGVGVASRGKLRGLSLPIAKAPPVASIPEGTVTGGDGVGKKRSSHGRSRSTSSATPTAAAATAAAAAAASAAASTSTLTAWNDQDGNSPQSGSTSSRDEVNISPQLASSSPTSPFHGYPLSHMSSTEPTPALPQGTWGSLPLTSTISNGDGRVFHTRLPHIITTPNGDMLSASVDTLSDVDYIPSPLSHSFPREELAFVNSPAVLYDGYTGHNSPVMPHSPVAAIMIDQRAAPTSCPSLVYGTSEPSSSLPSHMDTYDGQMNHKLMHDCEPLAGTPELDAYSTSAQSHHAPFWPTQQEDLAPLTHVPSHDRETSSWPTVAEPQGVPISPELLARMPFYMDYYENTMCPSMVFIDGPNNPFRDHVLQLAAGSQSLRHAICALAACNLRMKRKLSLGQHDRELAEKRNGDRAGSESLPDNHPCDDQSLSAEFQHRNLAVQLLNEQLNDPSKARHDSVLATILMLCHYRMAESGIAKFHTQFAGVKKILGMRRMSHPGASRDSAWMEALFTYFDAISASINDRECQLNTSFYGVMPDAQLLPPGAENLVGCDRDLFKTIIKLGRLNLLSQHRAVQSLMSNSAGRGVQSRSQSPLASPLGHVYTTSSGSANHHRFDGNGFGSTLDDDELFSSALSSSAAYDGHRSAFWKEWKDARIALQSWEFDPQRIVAGLPGLTPPTHAQVRDLGSLSEAFRYAALLYTERLASPNVPSAHNNFRNLVSQVVYYATSLEAGSSAEKFLLWPLFVAGSECVNELQQNIVRSKCREIMARSGYMNNLAALDVLERLWAGDWKESDAAAKFGGMTRSGPFNWTRCIGGPGVEVEWIMF